MKFHIWCNGSPGVGIPGCQAVLDWSELEEDKNWRNDQEKAEYIKFVKKQLKTSFITIFDDPNTFVMTEEEFNLFTKEDN